MYLIARLVEPCSQQRISYSGQEVVNNMAVKKVSKKKTVVARPKKTVKKKIAIKKAAKQTVNITAKKTAPKPVKKTAKKSAAKAVKKIVGAAKKKALPAAPPQVQPVRISAGNQKRHALLKRILLKKRNDVVEGIESRIGRKLVAESGQKIDSAMDSADMSSHDFDQGIDYSLLEMKYEQYKDIADAFRKLESGSFGLCEECGDEIDIKRLEVNPLARFCIACKTTKENLEKIQKEETRFKE